MKLRTLLGRSVSLNPLNQSRVKAATLVSIKSFSKKKNSFTTRTREPGHPPRTHKQVVWSKDPLYDGTLSDCKDVMLTCNCWDFLFTWEHVLNKEGCTEILQSNGEPPNERNPGMRIGMCKHCIIVANYILSKNL